MFFQKYITPESKERKKVAIVILGKEAESFINSAEISVSKKKIFFLYFLCYVFSKHCVCEKSNLL